jgi:hypothetical protein
VPSITAAALDPDENPAGPENPVLVSRHLRRRPSSAFPCFVDEHSLNLTEVGRSEELLVIGTEAVPAVVSEESQELLVICEPRSLGVPELLLQVEIATDTREKSVSLMRHLPRT